MISDLKARSSDQGKLAFKRGRLKSFFIIKFSAAWAHRIVEEVQVGKIYTGKVKKIMDFGAFVEVTPGNDGLLHISEISHERIQRVTDVLKEGDVIDVKVLDVDRQGKMRLSRKVLLKAPEGSAPAPRQ